MDEFVETRELRCVENIISDFVSEESKAESSSRDHCAKFKSFTKRVIEKAVNLIFFDINLLSYPIGVAVEANSPIFESSFKMVERLFTGGIIQHVLNKKFEENYRKPDPVSNKPQILAVNDLSYGFIMWLGACVISLTFFLFEFLASLVTGRIRKLKMKSRLRKRILKGKPRKENLEKESKNKPRIFWNQSLIFGRLLRKKITSLIQKFRNI
jgi:hypothetical protein